MKKKDLPERYIQVDLRKAMEAEFVRQNLMKS